MSVIRFAAVWPWFVLLVLVAALGLGAGAAQADSASCTQVRAQIYAVEAEIRQADTDYQEGKRRFAEARANAGSKRALDRVLKQERRYDTAHHQAQQRRAKQLNQLRANVDSACR